MPGTIIFKPIQAKIMNDIDSFSKMPTYCCVTLGDQEIKGKACKCEGKAFHWHDVMSMRRIYEPYCTIKIMGKEWPKEDIVVGTVMIDLGEIEENEKLSKWYKISHENQIIGEILVESIFEQDYFGIYKHSSEGTEQPVSIHDVKEDKENKAPGPDYVHMMYQSEGSHELTSEDYFKYRSRQDSQPIIDEEYPNKSNVLTENIAREGNSNIKQDDPLKDVCYCPCLEGISFMPDKENFSYEPSDKKFESNQKIDSHDFAYYPCIEGVSYVPSKGKFGHGPVHEQSVSSQPNKTKPSSGLLQAAPDSETNTI